MSVNFENLSLGTDSARVPELAHSGSTPLYGRRLAEVLLELTPNGTMRFKFEDRSDGGTTERVIKAPCRRTPARHLMIMAAGRKCGRRHV